MTTSIFWEKAIPLAQAFIAFAPRDDAERYRELSADTSWLATLERTQQKVKAGAAIPDAFSQSVGPTGTISELRTKLQNQCLSWIRTGRLIAYGFAVPRKPDDMPIEIPCDLWDGLVKWDSSAVGRHGLRIEGVRLILPVQIEQIRAELSAQLEGRGQGRRTRKPQILEAFDALHRLGEIDYTGQMASCCPVIREWVMLKYPDDPDGEKGLDEKTVAKHIRALFNAQKADSKL